MSSAPQTPQELPSLSPLSLSWAHCCCSAHVWSATAGGWLEGLGGDQELSLGTRTSLGLLRVLLVFGTGLFPPSTPLIFISLVGSFSSCQLCLRGFKVQKFYIFEMNKWTDSQPDAVVNLRKGKCFPTASFIYEIITEPLTFMHILELSV